MPSLAERFTVIAPDLPGNSAIPADGLDMKVAAVRIHALMSSLGFQNAEVGTRHWPDGRLRLRSDVPRRDHKASNPIAISRRRRFRDEVRILSTTLEPPPSVSDP